MVRTASGTDVIDLNDDAASGVIPTATSGDAIVLEHGIAVTLSATVGQFLPGDHWISPPVPPTPQWSNSPMRRRWVCTGITPGWRWSPSPTPNRAVERCGHRRPSTAKAATAPCTSRRHPTPASRTPSTWQNRPRQLCLAPGTYNLRDTVRITDATNVRRGQGHSTVLVEDRDGTAIEVLNSAQITLESFSVHTSGGQAAVHFGATTGVTARMYTILVTHTRGQAPAIKLSSVALLTRLRDNLIVAPIGIFGSSATPLLTGALEVSGNLLVCEMAGIRLGARRTCSVTRSATTRCFDSAGRYAAIHLLGNVEPGVESGSKATRSLRLDRASKSGQLGMWSATTM